MLKLLLGNPWTVVAIAVFYLASMATAAWTGKEWAEGRHAQEEVARAKLLEEVRAANAVFADGVALQTVEAIAKIRITNRTITNEVRHEREIHRVLDNPDCRLPPSTAGVLNRARAAGGDGGGARAGQPAPAVPAAPAAAGKPAAAPR